MAVYKDESGVYLFRLQLVKTAFQDVGARLQITVSGIDVGDACDQIANDEEFEGWSVIGAEKQLGEIHYGPDSVR